ncbi:hypothetical protein [Amycolatopsis kentuckyensis]|uniref:hypothetical protein n=1 Tax=Amycolatopsis kentuckyensis TaxID=218823 RepID=UPI00356B4F1F
MPASIAVGELVAADGRPVRAAAVRRARFLAGVDVDDLTVPQLHQVADRLADALVSAAWTLSTLGGTRQPPSDDRHDGAADAVAVGEPAGPSAWDGYAVTVIGDALVEALRTGRIVGVTMKDRPAQARVNGALDDRFPRVTHDPLSLDGRYTAERVAAGIELGLRRGLPRPRNRVVDGVPARVAQGRPGHGGQHRARGPRAGHLGRPPGGGGSPELAAATGGGRVHSACRSVANFSMGL